MADIHKNVVITPSRGLTTDPTIVITGGGNDPMTIRGLSSGNTGTIAFEGSAGQLFAITNNMTEGDIFTVADISGLPVMSANTSRTLTVNETAIFLRGFTASGATFTSNVAMTSTSSYTGLASFAGGFTSSGATFTGNVAMTSTSSYTGLASFAGGINITGNGITYANNSYQSTAFPDYLLFNMGII